MATYLFFIILCTAIRTQGSLLEFGSMIRTMTERDPIKHYAFYGCYCGFGGRGAPVDDIDWCCHQHDCCFDVMSSRGCSPKATPYFFSIEDGTVTCDSSWNSDCARGVCVCDRVATSCFRKHNGTYSQKYMTHPQYRCTGPTPGC